MQITPLADLEDRSFDPFLVEKLSTGDCIDPYPVLHALREKAPVHEGSYRKLFTDVPDVLIGDKEQYIVVGYDAVLHVLTNPEIFTNRDAFIHTLGKSFGRTVTVMDAPEHGRYRKIFQKAFLPGVVSKWGESVVDPVVERLMAAFLDRGRADLVEEFTHHYPFQVIYSQLRIDQQQASIFHKLAIAQLLSTIGAPQGDESTAKLGVFFEALLAARRAEPGDDLVSHLATVEVDGERLPDEVLIAFLRQLMNAGGDTTYRGTSILLTGLLQNPDQLRAVEADRTLIAAAIEEAVRWDGPVTSTLRYVAQDTEIAGVPVPAGAILNVVLGSANRDPSKFENPDQFNIFRERRFRHVAFANGPHVCIGQHLARVEMTRAVNAILDNMADLRLDPAMPPPAVRGHILRVPEHLHVAFERRRAQ